MDSRITTLIHDFVNETKKQGVEISTVILFGSQSDGTASDESDVDIALISSSFQNLDSLQRRKRIKPALYRIMKQYNIPIDLILLTPEEYDTESSIRMSFIRNGITILTPA